MKPILFLTAAFLFFACNNPTDTKTNTRDSVTDNNNASAVQKEEPWVPADSAAAMKAWMDYATPGDPHKMLAKGDGEWEGDVTMWMAPDAPPVTNKATANNKTIMEGRYQLSTFKGNFMGQPFEGMSMMGYDNIKKAVVSSWIDNMGTGILKMEGPWDGKASSITLTGKMIDPGTGRECESKEIYTFVDNDHHTMEMFGPDPKTGKTFKSMEIKFVRKK